MQPSNARVLAVAGEKRLPLMPNVPTVRNSAVRASLPVTGAASSHPPAPPAIIQKLNAELTIALQTPRVRQVLRDQGLEIIGNSPEEFHDADRQSGADHRADRRQGL
ncbi:tripartite tricarboxylate transporter substrate-binding protein [Rhodoplanes roseus]|uniref:Uncharacterized protein n=1 Tax=Rhodoplanes roseus TaxID=29409 RepID=A0A327L8Z1_9BRAD|nr:hypothetical protein CH341_01325 [Rhodoplanes roseus]